MTVDMTQFYQTFFEESFEGLDIMESALLNLNVGAADSETIHTIFRAAHSIKGGSATFGFADVAALTHVLETLLDEMRAGSRPVTQQAIDLLLQSVDCLREMLTATHAGNAPDRAQVELVQAKLEQLLHGAATSTEPTVNDAESAATRVDAIAAGWRIHFKPHSHLLSTGNDPVRMFRELASLGELTVEVDDGALPAFREMDPESAYLGWVLTLQGQVSRQSIEEIFEWVDGDCDLKIIPLDDRVAETAETVSADASAPFDNPLRLDVDVLEVSFNLLAPQADALVKRFYEELFKRRPELQSLFVHTDAADQRRKLVAALQTVVSALRRQGELADVLKALGARHQSYGVKPESYEVVVATLLDVMAEFAGEAWTREVYAAWHNALNAVAATMLQAYTAPTNGDTATVAKERAPAKERVVTAGSDTGSIRVSIDKIDALINMVGELVITQSMLGQLGEDVEASDGLSSIHLEKLRGGLAQLERNTRELQESVMRIRMLPISFAFHRLPRMVRDLSQKLNKQVELKLSGEQTELDKTVMEKIGDPLVHLVRNAIDHGIELPDARKAAGKPDAGLVHLNAYHQGGNIVIEIRDDGAGLHKDKILAKARERGLVGADERPPEERIHDLIFEPGFSTATTVSDVSGRGVGMDVVKRNIKALGGSIEIESAPGVGSTFTIRLPLTLAIADGQLISVGDQTYIIPLISIVESLQIRPEFFKAVSGKAELYKVRDDYVPIIRLYQVFGIEPINTTLEGGLLVVVEGDGQRAGLFVDDLLGQQQVVIKSLDTNFRRVQGVSGATILGDGTVALILDIGGLIELSRRPRPGNFVTDQEAAA